MNHEKNATTPEYGIFSNDFQIGYSMVGEKIDRVSIDWQIESVIASLFINQDIFVGRRRE